MDLSLEEIIRKNRIGINSKKAVNRRFPLAKGPPSKMFAKQPQPQHQPASSAMFKRPRPLIDARLKIIESNRAKIRDARDKLVEITRTGGDARQRLMRKHSGGGPPSLPLPPSSSSHRGNYRNGHVAAASASAWPPPRKSIYKTYGGSAMTRRHPALVDVAVPRGYIDYDDMERIEEEEYAIASRLSRTVTNDIDRYADYSGRGPVAPSSASHGRNSWMVSKATTEEYDPFDGYELSREHHERSMAGGGGSSSSAGGGGGGGGGRMSPDHLSLSSSAKGGGGSGGGGGGGGGINANIIMRSTERYDRRYSPEPPLPRLSYEMRSRLQHAPDPHASMGIFAKDSPMAGGGGGGGGAAAGYRIVVSNLHASVSNSDIEELFSDIGDLYDSHIVRPGIAEVIYKSLGDAEKAVDTYHNRQLDGLPMKCMLVNPRASSKPTAPAIKNTRSNLSSRHSSGKAALEVDIDALHKVLFRSH